MDIIKKKYLVDEIQNKVAVQMDINIKKSTKLLRIMP